MFPLLDVTHKYPVGAWAASTRRWQSLSASAVSRFQIRICYQRRRSQAGPQRPAPSLLAARSSHHRPATELAVSRPRAPRRRRAPAPPCLQATGGCSARLQLYSQAGTARASGGGGPRSAGAGGGARKRGEGARTSSPAPRAPSGGRGPGKGARWGRGRAAATSASCAPGGSRCTSRPPLPPGPGPWVLGAGRGTGCGAAGEWGAGHPPQPREVLEVRGMGRNPAIRPYSRSAFTWCPSSQMRPNRGPRFGASPRPHLWPFLSAS